MRPSQYDVKLRFWHPKRRIEEIVKTLRLKPEWGWNQGDPRRTPRGKVLEGLRLDSYLTIDVKGHRDGPAAAVERQTKRLASRRRLLRAFARSGGEIEYWVSIFEENNSGEVFPHALLEFLGRLNINLSVEVFRGRRRA